MRPSSSTTSRAPFQDTTSSVYAHVQQPASSPGTVCAASVGLHIGRHVNSVVLRRYLDALVLAAYFAPCGVAKADVATLPIIGTITRGLQFLFVARSGTTGAAFVSTHNFSSPAGSAAGTFSTQLQASTPARGIKLNHKAAGTESCPMSWCCRQGEPVHDQGEPAGGGGFKGSRSALPQVNIPRATPLPPM